MAADLSAPDLAAAPTLTKMKIFISYPHEDLDLANALRDAILDLDRSLIDVFLDQSHIAEGKEITETITDALTGTSFFIGIGTDAIRAPYAWCGVELGYFLAENKGRARSVGCLYHDEIPDVFHSYRNIRVVSLADEHTSEFTPEIYSIEHAPLTSFFRSISNDFNNKFHARDAAEFFSRANDWAKRSTREVTAAYFKCLQTRVKEIWYPQKRLEIQIYPSDSSSETIEVIPPSSTVWIDNSTYSVLNLGSPAGGGTRGKNPGANFAG